MRVKLAVFALIISLLSACQSNRKAESSTEHFTIATLKGPSAMGMIWVVDSLAQLGTNATGKAVILNEPLQVRKMMLEGEADFAVLPTTMAAIMYNKKVDYQLLAIPVWGTLYLFGSDTTIHTWEQLRGKRINAMAKGMTPDVLFRYLLQQHGINPETDVTLDYSFPTHIDLANAVAANRASLGVISEPLVSLVAHKNPSVKAIMDLNKEWIKATGMAMPQTALMVKRQFAQQHPDVVNQVSAAFAHSTQWVNANPVAAAELIVKYDILPNAAVAQASIPRSNLSYVYAIDIKEQINGYLELFYKMNSDIVGGKVPDDGFYYKK